MLASAPESSEEDENGAKMEPVTAPKWAKKEETKTMDRMEWSKAVDVYSCEPSVFEVWDDLHDF